MAAPIIGITCSYHGDDDALIRGRRLLLLRHECVEAIEAAGGRVLILPLAPEPDAGEVLDLLDGLLCPGNDVPLPEPFAARVDLPDLREQNPTRYRSDARWLTAALGRGMPVFGICRGMQMLNEVLGGTLHSRLYPPEEKGRHSQALPGNRPWHDLEVEPGTLLHRLIGAAWLQVNSYHVQGVDRIGAGLRISARAPDGVVEAVEGVGPAFVLGVQFHPEQMLEAEPALGGAFAGFIAAAAAYRTGNPSPACRGS